MDDDKHALISRLAISQEYFFEEGCYIIESWNTDDDQNCSIARVRLPVGRETEPHRLAGTGERYVILSGEALVFIGDRPGTKMQAGDVCYIPPQEKQSVRNIGEEDLLFLAICTPRFTPSCYQSASKLT